MRAIGIIAEFNPFHQGHSYLIRTARQSLDAEVCVAVMSGNFSQRGMPCVQDKWHRAREAVRGGVDLVVELPVVFATGTAEIFAKGGVSVLEGFGAMDHLVFGSESGDIRALQETGRFLGEHEARINREAAILQKNGLSYPRARELTCTAIDPDFNVSLLREPNNILALEYLKWCQNMGPFTVKRSDLGYHVSGTAHRKDYMRKDPQKFSRMEQTYFDLVRYSLLRMSREELQSISGSEGGLGFRLAKEMTEAGDLETLIDKVKTKGYTRTRVTRLLTHVLLGITEKELREAVPYIRVLALNRTGAAFLKHCTKQGCLSLPLLTNAGKERARYPGIRATLEKDVLAGQVYSLLIGESMYGTHDFVRQPVIENLPSIF